MAALPPSPEGNHNRAHELLIVTWLWCALSLIAVALRLYSRIRITRNLWWDDWVIFFTMVREFQRRKRIRKVSEIASLGTHNNIFCILHALCGQRWRSPHCILEPCAARGDHQAQLGLPNILYHGHSNGQSFRCYPDGPTHVTKQMAEMGSIFLGHLNLYSSLHSYHLYLRPMLATKDALDTHGGQMLEPRNNQPSRRAPFQCVSNFGALLFTELTLQKGWSAFVDFALAVFGITMIWNLQLSRRKKAGLSAFLGLGILYESFLAYRSRRVRLTEFS